MATRVRTAPLAAALLLAAGPAWAQRFDFGVPADPVSQTPAPFTLVSGGLAATFSAVGATDPYRVRNDFLFSSFAGNYLRFENDIAPGRPVDPGVLLIAFDRPLTALSFAFGMSIGPTPDLTIEAYLGGTLVGAATATGRSPVIERPVEGVAVYTGGPFDNVRVVPRRTVFFGIDNLSATVAAATVVPEPATLALVGAGAAVLLGVARRRFG